MHALYFLLLILFYSLNLTKINFLKDNVFLSLLQIFSSLLPYLEMKICLHVFFIFYILFWRLYLPCKIWFWSQFNSMVFALNTHQRASSVLVSPSIAIVTLNYFMPMIKFYLYQFSCSFLCLFKLYYLIFPIVIQRAVPYSKIGMTKVKYAKLYFPFLNSP